MRDFGFGRPVFFFAALMIFLIDCHVNLKNIGKKAKKIFKSVPITDFKVCAQDGIRNLTHADAQFLLDVLDAALSTL